MRSESASGIGLMGIVLLASTANGGDLNPPGGAVAPTMKTLQEVEPRRPISMDDVPLTISIVGGSFYLTENLFALGVGQNCITVEASDVTIDLNGFTIGRTEVGFWNAGIGVLSSATNVAIRNGTIQGCGGRGISAGDSSHLLVEGVRVYDCGGIGILAGNSAIVRGCVAGGNLFDGIEVKAGSTVENSVAHSNQGSWGIRASNGSILRGCAAYANEGSGINLADHGVAIGCSAQGNMLDGFASNLSCQHVGCTAAENGDDGFSMNAGCSAINCVASENGGDGFTAAGTLIRACVARTNGRHGIIVSVDCTIDGNLCDSNGTGGSGAGIATTASDNRIVNNNVTDNTFGMDINGAGCFIVSNCASGNTSNFSIVPGNAHGQIYDFSGGGVIQSIVINGTGIFPTYLSNFIY